MSKKKPPEPPTTLMAPRSRWFGVWTRMEPPDPPPPGIAALLVSVWKQLPPLANSDAPGMVSTPRPARNSSAPPPPPPPAPERQVVVGGVLTEKYGLVPAPPPPEPPIRNWIPLGPEGMTGGANRSEPAVASGPASVGKAGATDFTN